MMRSSDRRKKFRPQLGRRLALGTLIAAGYGVYLGILTLVWLRDASLHTKPEILLLICATNVGVCAVLVDVAILLQWAAVRLLRTTVEPPTQFSPGLWRWLWWCVTLALLIYPAWLLFHSRSFGIVNGTVAAIGPILVGVVGYWHQKDWRFLALVFLYPFIVLFFILLISGFP